MNDVNHTAARLLICYHIKHHLHMKRTVLISLLALSCCYMQACNDNRKAKNYNQKTLLDDAGLAFIHNANEAGNTEIAAAKVAEQKSQNPRVTNYAKMMITDHAEVGADLKKLAVSKYVTLSAGDSLSQEHSAKVKEISALSGPAFDKAYMQMMIMDHQKVIQMFQDATNNTNSGLTSFAQKNISKLQMHLDSAKAISGSLK